MHQGSLLFRESGWVIWGECEERWEFGGLGAAIRDFLTASLTPFLPLVMHVLIRERRPRKEPSFGSALAGGVSGDTLLQQTSMMVEHRRPG